MMYRLLLCGLLAFCSGCAKDHTKPPANLSFESVEEKSRCYTSSGISRTLMCWIFLIAESELG
jgi:hypothetical protein